MLPKFPPPPPSPAAARCLSPLVLAGCFCGTALRSEGVCARALVSFNCEVFVEKRTEEKVALFFFFESHFNRVSFLHS